MLTDCVNYYVESMQKIINEAASYLSQSELVTSHQNTKSNAIEEVGILLLKIKLIFWSLNSFSLIVPIKTETWWRPIRIILSKEN